MEKNKLRIWHISDTHTFHGQLEVPEGIDIVIFSGDCSNPREPVINEQEVRNFITWFSKLPIKHKVFVAGNHDTSIERGYITRDNFGFGIHYLENQSVEIDLNSGWRSLQGPETYGSTISPPNIVRIWGSPHTPTFGMGWAFNKDRAKLHGLWATIPDNTDIVVTHGPPKGCLDLSYNRKNELELCGCSALASRMRALKPKLVLFGHIHRMEGINNAGTLKFSDHQTIYSNGSVVYDGRFDKGITSNGNILEI